MKITKAQLKEMVRKVVKQKLLEMDLAERGHTSNSEDDEEDLGRMNQAQLKKHLEQEKEKSQSKRAMQARHNVKKTTRGLELECGNDVDDVHDEESDEQEDYLSRLEKMVLRNEEKMKG